MIANDIFFSDASVLEGDNKRSCAWKRLLILKEKKKRKWNNKKKRILYYE